MRVSACQLFQQTHWKTKHYDSHNLCFVSWSHQVEQVEEPGLLCLQRCKLFVNLVKHVLIVDSDCFSKVLEIEIKVEDFVYGSFFGRCQEHQAFFAAVPIVQLEEVAEEHGLNRFVSVEEI